MAPRPRESFLQDVLDTVSGTKTEFESWVDEWNDQWKRKETAELVVEVLGQLSFVMKHWSVKRVQDLPAPKFLMDLGTLADSVHLLLSETWNCPVVELLTVAERLDGLWWGWSCLTEGLVLPVSSEQFRSQLPTALEVFSETYKDQREKFLEMRAAVNLMGGQLCVAQGLSALLRDDLDALMRWGWLFQRGGLFDAGACMLQMCLRQTASLHGIDNTWSAVVYNLLGEVERYRGLNRAAEHYHLTSLSIVARHHSKSSARYADVLSELAADYQAMKDDPRALKTLGQALSIYAVTPGKNTETYTMTAMTLGFMYASQHLPEKAIPLYVIYKKWLEAEGNQETSSYALVLNNMGEAALDLHNYPKAVRLCRASVKLYDRLLGDQHPQYADALGNLGQALAGQGHVTKGIRALEKALAIYHSCGIRDHNTPRHEGALKGLRKIARSSKATTARARRKRRSSSRG